MIVVTSQATASRYCLLWAFPFELPLKVFKTCLIGRDFYTIIKNASFSFPTDVRSHNSVYPFHALGCLIPQAVDFVIKCLK